MDKEKQLNRNIFKCLVGQASLDCYQFLTDSKAVTKAAILHLERRPIKNRTIRQAANALGLEIETITPVDSRLDPDVDPNTLIITIKTRFGVGRYHYMPPLEETFSES